MIQEITREKANEMGIAPECYCFITAEDAYVIQEQSLPELLASYNHLYEIITKRLQYEINKAWKQNHEKSIEIDNLKSQIIVNKSLDKQ